MQETLDGRGLTRRFRGGWIRFSNSWFWIAWRSPVRQVPGETGSRWLGLTYLREAVAQRAPGFFLRDINATRLRRVGGRENGEEDEALVERIVGAVDFALGNQNHFAGAEDAVLLADPLFGTAGQDIDEFLAGRVRGLAS